MDQTMLLVSSFTYAMKSRDILWRNGIQAYVQRVPRGFERVGCSYGVYIPERLDEAQNILLRSGIQLLGRVEGYGDSV